MVYVVDDVHKQMQGNQGCTLAWLTYFGEGRVYWQTYIEMQFTSIQLFIIEHIIKSNISFIARLTKYFFPMCLFLFWALYMTNISTRSHTCLFPLLLGKYAIS